MPVSIDTLRASQPIGAVVSTKTQASAAVRALGREPTPYATIHGQARATLDTLHRAGGPRNAGEAEAAAAKAVSEMFYVPLLSEIRDESQSGIFSGGRTESVFGEQLDQRLADAVAQTTSGALKAQLARALQGPAAQYAAADEKEADPATKHARIEVQA